MDEFDAKSFREVFLDANANEPFIAAQLADVIRYLMRAVTSEDPSSGLHSASEKMKFVAELLPRMQEPTSWYRLFTAAVEDIQRGIPDDPDERRFISAAKRGTKYLIESSATDGAARGRASRRLEEFRQAIRWSVEARGGRL